jgi:outer membrane protein TolC
VELYQQIFHEAHGKLEQVRGNYDPSLALELEWKPSYYPTYIGGPGSYSLHRLVPSARFEQKTRMGVVWNVRTFASFQLHELEYGKLSSFDDAGRFVQGASGMVSVPLFRSLHPHVVAGDERAAWDEYRASRLDTAQMTKEDVKEVVVAVWGIVAAQSRVEIAQKSEQRAKDLLEEIQQLAAAHERPASDVTLFQAAAQEALARRMSEDIYLSSQRARLGALLGLPSHVDYVISTPLPSVPEGRVDFSSLLEPLLGKAGQSGPTESLALKQSAAQSRMRQAHNHRRPDVRLSGQVHLLRRSNAFFEESAMTFPDKEVAGMVSLAYTWPMGRHAAEGLLAQQSAAYERAGLERQIYNNNLPLRIRSTLRELELASSRHGERKKMVDLYRRSLEDEQERFRLGMSTTIDVIQVEERYIQAQLNQVNDRLEYAISLASLATIADSVELEALKQHSHGALEPFYRLPGGQVLP